LSSGASKGDDWHRLQTDVGIAGGAASSAMVLNSYNVLGVASETSDAGA